MKLFFGILTLLGALFISSIAAYFSIIGLAAIFAATFTPVVVMTGVLEGGKIIAAAWLHANWKNRDVSWLHKLYLIMAVLVLMVVTAVGIYGFLSKGHFEQKAPLAGINLQIAQHEQSVAQIERENSRLQAKTDQFDKIIDAYLRNNKVTLSIKTKKEQDPDRNEIQKQITANKNEITRLNKELLSLRLQTSEVEASLGPVKYVAALFGWQDTSYAIRMLILLLMFSFDPLAIVLILSSSISLGEYFTASGNSKRSITTSSALVPLSSVAE
ncbi:membrane hypothetical protein [Gammaproteobacteria bacterium]